MLPSKPEVPGLCKASLVCQQLQLQMKRCGSAIQRCFRFVLFFCPFLPADALRPEMHLESRLSQAVRFPAASSSGCRPEDLDAESGDEKQRLLVESSQHQQIAFSGLNMVKFRLVHF